MQEEFIDLHIHSSFSDGDTLPEDLVQLAHQKGITTMSITDHDTTEGCKHLFRKNASNFMGIRFIPGIELTAKVPKGRMHVLGYSINIYDTELNKRLIEVDQENRQKVREIIQTIEKDDHLYFPPEEVERLLIEDHNIGRPDIAKLCIKMGYANSVSEAFDKYLVKAYEKVRENYKGIAYEECINLIRKSGGIAVLAHPYTLQLDDDELRDFVIELQDKGLQGLEVYHSNHDFLQRRKYLELAHELGLYVSGGSDYHGKTVKPNIELGYGKNNNLKIKKLSLLDHLSR